LFQAKCVFELIFYWKYCLLVISNSYTEYCLLVISNSYTEYFKQKNLSGFSTNCILGKRFIFVAIKMKHLRIIKFDVFYIKTQYLFFEYQKHISKSFDNCNHIFFSTRLLPRCL